MRNVEKAESKTKASLLQLGLGAFAIEESLLET
jgi:hypothetical protein